MKKELSKNQKVFVLTEMIRYYSGRVKDNEYKGMCYMILHILRHDLKIEIEDIFNICHVFPEFINNKPTVYDHGFWYEIFDNIPRLEYCKKLLKLIQK